MHLSLLMQQVLTKYEGKTVHSLLWRFCSNLYVNQNCYFFQFGKLKLSCCNSCFFVTTEIPMILFLIGIKNYCIIVYFFVWKFQLWTVRGKHN